MKNLIGLTVISMPFLFVIGMLYPPMMIAACLVALFLVICGIGLALSMEPGDFR